MSLPQIPSSHRFEYLVYLALAAVWVKLVATLIWTPPEIEDPMFLPVVSAVIASLLFLSRIDKRIDKYLAKSIIEDSNKLKLFMAQVSAFLTVWEFPKVDGSTLDTQLNHWIHSTIEGEDLHGEVWMRKGIIFFGAATPAAVLLLKISDWVQIPYEPLSIYVIYFIIIGIIIWIVKKLWQYRFDEFITRAEVLLKFRYLQQLLHTARTSELAQTNQIEEKPDGQSGRIQWGSNKHSDLKVHLVKQCEVLSAMVTRNEWPGFISGFLPIENTIKEIATNYMISDAFDTAVLALSESLSSTENVTSYAAKARWRILRVYINYLADTLEQTMRNKLNEVSMIEDEMNQASEKLFALIDPASLDIGVHKSVGRLLSHVVDDSISKENVASVEAWFNEDLNSLAGALSICSYMNAWTREKLFIAFNSGKCTQYQKMITEGLQVIPYHAQQSAFEALQVFLTKSPPLDDTVTALEWTVYRADTFLDRCAMNAIGYAGHVLFKHDKILKAIFWALEKSSDLVKLAASFALLKSVEYIEDKDYVIAELEKRFPVQDPYLEDLFFQILNKLGAKSSANEVYWNIGLKRCSVNEDEVKQKFISDPCGFLQSKFKNLCSYDIHSSLEALILLKMCPDQWIDSRGKIQIVIECINNTKHDEVRFVIAGLLIDQGNRKAYFEEMIDMLATSFQKYYPLRTVISHIIGSFGSVVTNRIESLFMTQPAHAPYPSLGYIKPHADVSLETIRKIVEGISRANPENAITSIFTLRSMTHIASHSHSLLENLQKLLTDSNTLNRITPCAIECLGVLGGPKSLEILNMIEERLDYWWLRELWMKARALVIQRMESPNPTIAKVDSGNME